MKTQASKYSGKGTYCEEVKRLELTASQFLSLCAESESDPGGSALILFHMRP